ncbi:MAG: hypothetical protein AAGD47_14670 [Pseudomonadota bacterium]
MFFVPSVAKQVSRMFHSADITELMPESLASQLRRKGGPEDGAAAPRDTRR